MEDEEKGRKGIALKANEDDQTYSSNNEDEVDDDEEMALIMRKFKRFYKKGFNNRGKKPPLKKGGQKNKNLCEKISFLEKCLIDYDVLKKKVSDLTLCVEKFTKGKETLKNFLALKDHLLIKMVLDILIQIFSQNKHGL
ncbi:hypothetical protein M9H77_26707 [Catharanthus roseus]|uniref:Uncharacterized protein n=1 Tax=Catharanthus roseus TaxID=4058 RepID=A0ACC0ACL1_CATRO|nr:hypothetical protein M9H77_26707 [Catharanthus roseus]